MYSGQPALAADGLLLGPPVNRIPVRRPSPKAVQ